MTGKQKIVAFQAFAHYFITGAGCMLIGCVATHLVAFYGLDLSKVVLLGSVYALGRVVTVYHIGKLVEKIGPKSVLVLGVLLLSCYILGIALIPNYYVGMVAAFLGGVGMGTQDTVCPVFLSRVFRKHYEAALSAGQAMFGLGGFAVPLFTGLMLSMGLPFYYALTLLLFVPIVMLLLVPTMKEKDAKQAEDEVRKEHVAPLYTKHRNLAITAVMVASAAYSSTVYTISLYTTAFAESIGFDSASAAFLLTVYSVGTFVGAIAFIYILRKVKARTVLGINSLMAIVALAACLVINKPIMYYIGLGVAGFFLGVLFSVIIAIATRIDHQHISRAGSMIALSSSASDVVTPAVTAFLISISGVIVSFYFAIIMLGLTLISAVVLHFTTSETCKEV